MPLASVSINAIDIYIYITPMMYIIYIAMNTEQIMLSGMAQEYAYIQEKWLTEFCNLQ